jgi:AraC-like DNA-binding protein
MIKDVLNRNLLHMVAAMPRVSIALILFVALCLLAVSLWLRRRETSAATPFMILSALAGLQALLVSLRWDFGIMQLRPWQIVLAAALPGAAWLCFRSAASGGSLIQWRNLIHAVPIGLIVLALIVLPDAIDIILIVTFLAYGAIFLRLALSGEASFEQTAFEGMFNMRRALGLLAFTMLGSALVDVFVFLDFLRVGGQHAATLIGIGNMIWLIALGASVALGSVTLPSQEEEPDDAPLVVLEAEDRKVAEDIQRLLTESGLAKKPGLTLSRLARRAALPARTVSNAINRVHGRNVSQFINDIRIEEACRLLRDSDISITQAIYESGFQTKSNFNREFLRVTGRTPRDWRKERPASFAAVQSRN